ncbi:MAG: hypothetical protein OXE85_04505 [Roseovarius sp.]|nr:hypothetical protein [Roseovarius sp.]
MATQRVAADWTERHAGKTQRRRGAQAGAVWCLALEEGWRKTPQSPDHRPIGTLAGPVTVLIWIGRSANMGDARMPMGARVVALRAWDARGSKTWGLIFR